MQKFITYGNKIQKQNRPFSGGNITETMHWRKKINKLRKFLYFNYWWLLMDFLPTTQKQNNKNNNCYDHQVAAWLFFKYHFSRFCMYVLEYGIYLSLSDSFHFWYAFSYRSSQKYCANMPSFYNGIFFPAPRST